MKRSEMVNLLYDKLLELYMVDFSTEERAEFLLKSIEEAGMLPPMLPIPEYAFQAEHKWEPEDD